MTYLNEASILPKTLHEIPLALESTSFKAATKIDLCGIPAFANQGIVMSALRAGIASIDGYIDSQPPEVQAILRKIRSTIREAAPMAIEKISYRMPAFALNGILVYFAAFKEHIGLYPPVRGGDKTLMKLKAKFEGPKGNLKFPIDQPIPYALIGRIVKLRVQQNMANMAGKRMTRPRKRKP
jgi:uncharacterized protein YdhG (YjbR/CyaY superfamily)